MMTSKSLRLYLLSLLATVAVGAFAWNAGFFDAENSSGTAVNTPAPAESAGGVAAAPQAGSTEDDTPASADDSAAATSPAGQVEVVAPKFDVVRVEGGGDVLIAGSAPGGSNVEIITGSRVLGKGEANRENAFVVVLEEPLAPGNYSMVLRATSPDGIVAMSSETAIVSIPETPTGEVLAIVDEPGKPTKLITAPVSPEEPAPAEEPAKEVAEVPQPATTESTPEELAEREAGRSAETQAAAADEKTGEAANIAAVPAAEQAAVEPQVAAKAEPASEKAAAAPAEKPAALQPGKPAIAVEAVEIEGDHVFVAGKASGGKIVRIYANKDLIGEAPVSEGGRFLVESVQGLAEGDYIIRADLLELGSADVIARAAVPFARTPGEMVAAVAPELLAPSGLVQGEGTQIAGLSVRDDTDLPGEMPGLPQQADIADEAESALTIVQAGQQGGRPEDKGAAVPQMPQPGIDPAAEAQMPFIASEMGEGSEKQPAELAAPGEAIEPVDPRPSGTGTSTSTQSAGNESAGAETASGTSIGDASVEDAAAGTSGDAASFVPVPEEAEIAPGAEPAIGEAAEQEDAGSERVMPEAEEEAGEIADPIPAPHIGPRDGEPTPRPAATTPTGQPLAPAGAAGSEEPAEENPARDPASAADVQIPASTEKTAEGPAGARTPEPAGSEPVAKEPAIAEPSAIEEPVAEEPAIAEPAVEESLSAAPAGADAPLKGGVEDDAAAMEATAPALQATSGSVIIRRGDTLWHISRRVYGRGIRYTTLYTANQDQIADPDRIWPGQVFEVPAVSEDGSPADLDAIADRAPEPAQ